jgi:hypothetical protein
MIIAHARNNSWSELLTLVLQLNPKIGSAVTLRTESSCVS